MYSCPSCRARSISALSRLAPPFDGHTACPACGAALRIQYQGVHHEMRPLIEA